MIDNKNSITNRNVEDMKINPLEKERLSSQKQNS